MTAPPSTSIPLLMPKLGLTMTEGVIAKWALSDGSRFSAGDVLLLVETDKVTFDVAAPADGEIVRVLASQGDVVAVGAAIAEWRPASLVAAPTFRANQTDQDLRAPSKRLIATPLARRLARQNAIDLAQVRPTGPGGRIKAIDVERASSPGAHATGSKSTGDAPKQNEDPTITASPTRNGPDRVRRSVADTMVIAKRDIPHFYLSADIEVNRLLELQDEINAAKPARKITLTHFIIAALRHALLDMPEMNTIWADGPLRLDAIDIGLAVKTEMGLLNPIIRNIADDDFPTLVRKVDDVVDRARSGQLNSGDTEGGAITVSNVGRRNVRYMTSIVVPGQSMILGVGSVQSWFRPDAAGAPTLKHELGVVLSADHRVHDGVTGADFLEYLRAAVTRPMGLIAGAVRRDFGAVSR